MKFKSAPRSLIEKLTFDTAHSNLYKDLYSWRRNLGSPVLLDIADIMTSLPKEIVVISWNLGIGRANFAKLFERLKDENILDISTDQPFIILAQEAYRKHPFVPGNPTGKFYGGRLRPAEREDIVQIAQEYKLSLRYMPSMHNGSSNSDRGNAILSNIALGSTWSLTLPHVKQNRVAVAVEILGLPQMVFVSAHLDVSGNDRLQSNKIYKFGAGRVAQTKELIANLRLQCGPNLLVGADLNTSLGGFDPVLKIFLKQGFSTGQYNFKHTFHGPLGRLRLGLDHIFLAGEQGNLSDIIRIDQSDSDKTRYIFGSDHHPLVTKFILKK